MVYFLPWDPQHSASQSTPIMNLESFKTFVDQKNGPWSGCISQQGLNVAYKSDRVFVTARSAPRPVLLGQACALDLKRFKLYSHMCIQRKMPVEFILHPIINDRVSTELYATIEDNPAVLFMVLGRVYKNFKAGFELGWKGKSTSNAGFSINYEHEFTKDQKTEFNLRQSYLGITDVSVVNQINSRLGTCGVFSYNSTNCSSTYGASAVYNIVAPTDTTHHDTVKSSTVGVRWTSDLGWGMRWNADFSNGQSGGCSIGGTGFTGEDVDKMKIGLHYTFTL
jgi:hypothetical protein